MSPDPLSASKVERVANCTASVILPSYPHTGKLAIAGTDRHSAEESEEPGSQSAILNYPNAEHEVAYVIDPKARTVRRIGAGMPRMYGADRHWYTVGVTLDLESITADTATAVDFKSRQRVTAAKRNWQVRLQALALNTFFAPRPVRAGIVYLDNGEQDFHDFTRFDHAATWTELEGVIAAVEGALGKEPKPHMGPWCSYCEAVVSCPAVNQALRGLMESIGDGPVSMLTPEAGMPAADVAKLHPVLKAIKAKYDRMWEALRLRAKVEDLPLGNGRHLRMIEDRRGVWTLSERKDEQ
jgi:hypothetical protein